MTSSDGHEPDPMTTPVERSFTCTVCGYATTYEEGRLRTDAQATCLNCGDWTVQSAEVEAVVDDARDVAEALSGELLSERQALAYLLREYVGLDRRSAAEAMDSSPSNVDNLQRRGREKMEAARQLVANLDALRASTEVDGGENEESSSTDG